MRFCTMLSVVGATLLGGLLAGLALDKAIVQFPAWREMGSAAWLAYTKRAELGRGLVFYPALGLAALAFNIVANACVFLDRSAPRPVWLPVSAAAGLAVTALLVTRFEMAPYMLNLRIVD